MNETPTPEPSPPEPCAPAPPQGLPRLRFPAICLVLFWGLSFGMGAFDKPYFIEFMSRMASTALLTALLLGWWWFSRGLGFRDKLFGFLLVCVEAALAARFSHRSIGPFGIWMGVVPLMASLIVIWFFLAKRLALRWVRAGAALVATVTLGSSLLARVDGADSSLRTKRHWRWTPTTEEQFLANTRSLPAAAGRPQPGPGASLEPSALDWVAFRGKDRDGVVHGTTIATNWTEHPPKLVWKHGVGPAWSSLIVVGNRLFTQEQRGEKELVVCYDAGSGAEVWAHEDMTRFDEPVSGPGPRATPTFAGGRLYALGGTGRLNCLETGTGRVVWTRDIKEDSGAPVPMWAFASSPLVSEQLVIVHAGGEAGKGLLAYRAASGELAWAVPAGLSSYSSPQLTTLAGVPQCLMLHDSGLTAVDPATGKKFWQTGLAIKNSPRSGQPRLVGGNQLLVAALGGLGCSLVEVSRKGDDWTVSSKWDTRELKPEFPDFVVHQGHAYGFDVALFCCLELANGKRTWKEGRYGRGQVVLLADQGALLISSETGELILLAADARAHNELGRFQAVEGKTWNHAVVRGDRLYLRNAQEMACYSASAQGARGN